MIDPNNAHLQYLVQRWQDANDRMMESMVAQDWPHHDDALTERKLVESMLARFIVNRVQDGYILARPSATDKTQWHMIDEDTQPIIQLDNRLRRLGNGGGR